MIPAPILRRGSLKLGTLWVARPVPRGISSPGAVVGMFRVGLWPLCRPVFSYPLPGRSGPALSLPRCVRGLGRLANFPERVSDLLTWDPAARGQAGPHRAIWLALFPRSAFLGPGAGGRRRVRRGGTVPYFTRYPAGVRRSSDK